ncbi:AMP-binding protein [Lentzea sp. NPDC051213]|uniref:AMP-binding protein n=1 Tax=Lentzea sp. NPDC051213 TaxID=3364126 RepID=UPI0037BCF4AB
MSTLWPRYASPDDLPAIEVVPLADRGLPASTYALLKRAADLWPHRRAITILPEPVTWTFAELLRQVHRYANLLRDQGFQRDDAIALMSADRTEMIPAILAAQLVGIAMPINPALSPEHVRELLARSGARVPDLSGDAPSTYDGELPGSEDLAAFFHTGGTTGAPKLAAHTHANEVANAWMLAASELLDEDSVLFAGLPLFHVNALIVTLLTPLFKGQHVVWSGPLGYREPALYGEFWRIVEHYRITTMSAVPTVYSVLAQCPVNADISSLRFAMVGAAPLPPAVRNAFETHTGVPLVEGYGLTEATCATARSFPGTPRPGSVGQRLPYQQVKVRDGVLAISGPTVFAGYVKSPGGLDEPGEWLDTGDLAAVDDDGFIRLSGRAKDLILRGGHNIDPAVIEDALLSHPAVTAASAVGRPDPHAGEVPVAYVTLGVEATPDELLAWAGERVPERVAAPKEVVVLDALPLTAIGKPSKLELRADATRRAFAELDVDVVVEDGAIVVLAEEDAKRVLDEYAVAWRIK